MEWLVMKVVYRKRTGHYVLELHAGTIKVIAEVASEPTVVPGDRLYPVMDAMYLINRNEHRRLKAVCAYQLSASPWNDVKNALKKKRKKQKE
ncbi:signal transduction protein PmrD [Enterobacter kobei]|uniref:signal transduction protein PmrD n=1 Tax=Enterobacter kobei TaxID=208224 RepID=UPI003F54C117